MNYFVITTPRSGSNLFCENIELTNYCYLAREIFNPEMINNNGKLIPLKEYINRIINKHTNKKENKAFGFKILWSQLETLIINGVLDEFNEIFHGYRVVYLYRENIIKQAISLYFAFNFDIWTSNPNRLPKSTNISYDFKRIYELLERIETHNRNIRRFLSIYGIKHLEVSYESFLSNKKGILENTLQHILNINSITLDKLGDSRRFRKQKNILKNEFTNRFISEFQKKHFFQ